MSSNHFGIKGLQESWIILDELCGAILCFLMFFMFQNFSFLFGRMLQHVLL